MMRAGVVALTFALILAAVIGGCGGERGRSAPPAAGPTAWSPVGVDGELVAQDARFALAPGDPVSDAIGNTYTKGAGASIVVTTVLPDVEPRYRLSTGLHRIHGMRAGRTPSGAPVLFVLGVRERISGVGGMDVFVDANRDGVLTDEELVAEVTDSAGPSDWIDVAVTPEATYVLDWRNHRIRVVTDTNADGVADALRATSFAHSGQVPALVGRLSIRFDRSEKCVELADSNRVSRPRGRSTVLRIRDADADHVADAFDLVELRDPNPSPAIRFDTLPQATDTWVDVVAPVGARVAVDRVDDAGVRIQTIGTSRLPAGQDRARVPVDEPLVGGWKLGVRIIGTGESPSVPIDVRPFRFGVDRFDSPIHSLPADVSVTGRGFSDQTTAVINYIRWAVDPRGVAIDHTPAAGEEGVSCGVTVLSSREIRVRIDEVDHPAGAPMHFKAVLSISDGRGASDTVLLTFDLAQSGTGG